jgi:hypothetical protein
VEEVGRGVEIWTPDLLRPRQARYQAALRPDGKRSLIIKRLRIPKLLRTADLTLTVLKLCQNDFIEPSLCQNSLLQEAAFRLLTVDLFQGFSLHLQLHLRIPLENVRVTLTKQLSYPFVGYAART